jgi:hypothetical protein
MVTVSITRPDTPNGETCDLGAVLKFFPDIVQVFSCGAIQELKTERVEN